MNTKKTLKALARAVKEIDNDFLDTSPKDREIIETTRRAMVMLIFANGYILGTDHGLIYNPKLAQQYAS